MKLTTYVNFPGNCDEAMKFYEKHLGAKVLVKMTFNQMPANGAAPQNLPPGLKPEGVMHARLTIADTLLMVSDGPADRVQPMRSAYLTLNCDSNEEVERIYDAMREGGEVHMAIGETFFAHRFAQVRDKFGVNWMLIHEKPMGPR